MTDPISQRRPPWVLIAAVVVVLLAGLVAVVATIGDDPEEVEGQVADSLVVGGAGGGESVTSTTGPTDSTDSTDSTEVADPSDGSSTTADETDPPDSTTTGAGSETSAGAPALAPYVAGEEDPAIGQTIPTVAGADFDGTPVTIAPDGRAKVVLFVAHWCPHCQAEVPRIVEHLASSPMPGDVDLLTVSTAVAPDRGNYPPQAWLEREGWTAPVLVDDASSTAAEQFGLAGFPYFLVVDADGKVVFRVSGELSTDQFDQLVEAARTGSL